MSQLWSVLHRREPQEKYSPRTADEKSPPPTISSSVQYTKQDDEITYGNILGESLYNYMATSVQVHPHYLSYPVIIYTLYHFF